MAKADNLVQRVFAWAVLVCVAVTIVVVYLHLDAQHRQDQRELNYYKAHQQVAAEKQQRLLDYQRRLKEQQLQRQYYQSRRAAQL